jgi:hypothetical protein
MALVALLKEVATGVLHAEEEVHVSIEDGREIGGHVWPPSRSSYGSLSIAAPF